MTLVSATNSIFGDLAESVAVQRDLGIDVLDLKDRILGRELLALDDAGVAAAAAMIADAGLPVYCLSTVLFESDLADGEPVFARDVDRVDRAIEIARVLRPRCIRLLAASSASRGADEPLDAHLDRVAPWLVGAYRAAIAKIDAAGFRTVIENEVGASILRDVADVQTLLPRLQSAGEVGLIWDVQNLWRTSGRMPSIDTYRALRPFVRYVHVKGGRMDASGAMTRSTLAETTWPVEEILGAIVADRTSEVVCVNPCKGAVPPEGYDAVEGARDDVRTVQRIVRRGERAI